MSGALQLPAERTLVRPGWLTLALTLALAALLLGWMHDRFWWPPDEGVYAYVADRMLQGAALHRDLQDLHPGYGQLVNVGAFALFGRDLVSLRYPLVATSLVEAWIVFRLLRGHGSATAVLGALATAGLTVPLFLNPAAHWYALFFSCLLGALLAARPQDRRWRVVGAGALIGLAFFSRQSSGAFAGAGALLWLLLELHRAQAPDSRRGGLLGPLALLLLALGLGTYLLDKTSGLALPLFGLWPLGLLLLGATTLRAPDRQVLPLLLRLAAGFLLSALPLALFSLAEGAFLPWLRDTFLTPWRNIAQDFFAFPGYTVILTEALKILRAPPDLLAVASALFWLCLLALAPAVGLATCWRFRQALRATPLHPLVLLAPFLALVAVHFQIPVYFFFALAPLLWSALWLAPRGRAAWAVGPAVAYVLAVGLLTQAAQPLTRPLAEVVSGRRLALDAPEGLPGASLAMERSDQQLYRALLERIAAAAPDGQTILALPMNPELYFLSQRRPPVPWYASQLGLGGPQDVEAALAAIAANPPALLIHREDDKYNSPETLALLAALQARYVLSERLGGFALYRPAAQD